MIAPTPPAGRLTPTAEPTNIGYAPLCDPQPGAVGDRPAHSLGTMETLFGDMGLSTWGSDDLAVLDSGPKVQLQLAPDCPIVIGRQETGIPPYLDPTYRSTRVVPGTGQTVVGSAHDGKDQGVSRAHFMLRGDGRGIVVTNGVPRVGGGIRPPVNNTWLLEPSRRPMDPGEEYLIEHGARAVLWLVNGTVVQICAE